MDKEIIYNEVKFKKGDILFQSLFVDRDLESLIDVAVTSTSYVFNFAKVSSENLDDICKEFIDFYLKQDHQEIMIASCDGDKYNLISPERYYVVTSVKEFKVELLKFYTSEKYSDEPTTHSMIYVNRGHSYIRAQDIKKIYDWKDIQNIWSHWVKNNFVDIFEGRIGTYKHLMF